MRIAIVDDEEEMREAARRYLAKMLAQYWSKEAAVVQLDLFDSAEALLERFGRIEEVKLHDGCFLRPISREHLRQIATRRLAHLFLIIDNSNAHPFPPFCFRMTPSFI